MWIYLFVVDDTTQSALCWRQCALLHSALQYLAFLQRESIVVSAAVLAHIAQRPVAQFARVHHPLDLAALAERAVADVLHSDENPMGCAHSAQS
jgi:hypothetical protein